MGWFLKVREGRDFRDVAVLSESRQTVIGRSPSADVSFPDDHEMSGRHARVQIVNGVCQFEDLQSTNGTFLNEERAERGQLAPGQLLKCGSTYLVVESDTNTPTSNSPAGASKTTVSAPHDHKAMVAAPLATQAIGVPEEVLQFQGFVAGTAAEIFERFQLSSVIELKPADSETPAAFAKRAIHSKSINDGLNFLARALHKRMGVWWAIQCIRDVKADTGPHDPQILELAEQWVIRPSEQLRRELMKRSEAAQTSTPAAWAGVAVFWTHGSMAPPEAPAVPAGPELAGKAVSGSVILAAVATSADRIPQRREAFINLGLAMAAGQKLWPEASR
ncbi:MAG: FHA domain-containing protein [Planctomyces sp.]|nr:FHA domain-containing protein [Planctomyces sp.]